MAAGGVQQGAISVVELPLYRLVHEQPAALGLPDSALARQVEAAEGVARQPVPLDAVPHALSEPAQLGLPQEARMSRESSCVAARMESGGTGGVHSADRQRHVNKVPPAGAPTHARCFN